MNLYKIISNYYNEDVYVVAKNFGEAERLIGNRYICTSITEIKLVSSTLIMERD